MVNKKIFLILFLLVILVNLHFILGGCEEGQIDINTASLEELDELWGIGLTKGQAIIDSRPFDSVDDLINVSGIGEVTLENIKSQGLACVAEEDNGGETNQSSSENESEEEDKEEDPESEIIYITQESNQEKKNKVLDTINLNTEKNTERLTKSDYALYGLGIFAVVIIILFLLRKNKYQNEFR